MKSLIITYFLMLSCALSLAMEIELSDLSPHKSVPHDYHLLTEATLDTIREQQRASHEIASHEKKRIFHQAVKQLQEHSEVSLSSLQLSTMHAQFCAMSETYKRALLHIMSTRLLLLSCVAICLPEELVKQICYCLLEGDAVAAENFYQKPISHIFDHYNIIKRGLADDTTPIGPLYTADESERDLVLRMKAPWYYDIPIMTEIEKAAVDQVSDNVKKTYLQGREIMVLPDESHKPCTPYLLYRDSCFGAGAGLLIAGIMESCFAVGGVICQTGPGLAGHAGALAASTMGGICACGAVCCACSVYRLHDYFYIRAERVVL